MGRRRDEGGDGVCGRCYSVPSSLSLCFPDRSELCPRSGNQEAAPLLLLLLLLKRMMERERDTVPQWQCSAFRTDD